MNGYGYQQYKQQCINTMTQSELLITLFDEAIKRLGMAEMALKNNKMENFDKSVDRTSEIIRYLNKTLNKSYSISAEISRMYDFFLYELARVKAGRNIKVINEIKPMIMDLRNTFKEADRISHKAVKS
ncbi:MAG: flagellar protein FliS [Clostridia bacterium]|jgi:flagellar protein FliS|nr:flagellar protein FliS [Clostridia bacterium]